MSQDSTHLQKSKNPIFIHSLFRAGSTYLFHVFRRSEAGYCCYQEPLHEISFYAKNDYGLLLNENNEQTVLLRHPRLNKPYFFELYKVADKCLPTLKQEAIYDSYFNTDDNNFGIEFWSNLINESSGQPVIQECRTSLRIGKIKSFLGGFHIYLWRNPWDQWWSHKVTEYFDAANQMFINAPKYPEIIARLRQEIGFTPCKVDNIGVCIESFMEHKLTQENSYLIFYVLWFLGFREAQVYADVMLNIDRLSDSTDYRQEFTDNLMNSNIISIDFSDCSIPQAIYTKDEKIFFEHIEDKAHGLLLLSGVSKHEIDQILIARAKYEPKIWHKKKFNNLSTGLIRDAERARSLVHKAEAIQLRLRTSFAALEHKCNAANFKIQELTNELSLVKIDDENILAEQQTRNQRLQNEWDAAKPRLDALVAELAIEHETLMASEDALAKQQAHNQWLQNKWDTAQTQLEAMVAKLAAATYNTQQLTEQLIEKNQVLSVRESTISEQQTHSQWLQNEWNAAKAKVDELNHTAHHWWTVADGLNREVQSLYHRKSWRITYPLRKALELLRWLIGLLKRSIKRLVLIVMLFVLTKPRMKFKLLNTLERYPEIKNRLRQLAVHNELNTLSLYVTEFKRETTDNKVDYGIGVVESASDISHLTSRARNIYSNLKHAISQHENEKI